MLRPIDLQNLFIRLNEISRQQNIHNRQSYNEQSHQNYEIMLKNRQYELVHSIKQNEKEENIKEQDQHNKTENLAQEELAHKKNNKEQRKKNNSSSSEEEVTHIVVKNEEIGKIIDIES